MKKKIIKILAVTLVIAMTIALTGCSSKKEKKIAVVAKGESHAFWQSVKKGAEEAGSKYGYKITFRGPASESAKDLPAQKEMVQTALSNNVSGLVIATIGEGFTDQLMQAYDMKLPIVQFDSGVWKKDLDAINTA
ncbi:MAG: substrate-binding domain-containing protein, partial [Clostridia bacterium]